MNTKTITLTGEEIAVQFDRNYPYFWVINHGDSNVYMSDLPGIIPGSDGVITVPADGGRSSGDVGQVNTLYFLGSGEIEVSPQFNGICPFFKPRKGGDNSNILNGAIYRYKNEITVNSTIIDTGIPQNVLSGKGFTAAFVFMSDTWSNFYGLFGLHNGSVVDTHGLCCQYGGGYLSLVLPNCRGDCGVAPPSGEKTVLILSDNADKSYIYYNGVRHDIVRYSNMNPFIPFNNICLLRSFSGGGNERYYQGTIYDIALFDRGLSDNECTALTAYFAGLYDIKI